MVDHPRAIRLAERIQVIVAQMLDTRVKDPRLGFVTVTAVRCTGDLQHASIFYTVLGDAEARAASAAYAGDADPYRKPPEDEADDTESDGGGVVLVGTDQVGEQPGGPVDAE